MHNCPGCLTGDKSWDVWFKCLLVGCLAAAETLASTIGISTVSFRCRVFRELSWMFSHVVKKMFRVKFQVIMLSTNVWDVKDQRLVRFKALSRNSRRCLEDSILKQKC